MWLKVGQSMQVRCCDGTAPLVVLLQSTELDTEQCSLQLVQPGKVRLGQPGYDADPRAQTPCCDRAVIHATARDRLLDAIDDDTVHGEMAEHEEVEEPGVRMTLTERSPTTAAHRDVPAAP